MPETWDVRRFEQAPVTVVLHEGVLADDDDRAWMGSVSKEEPGRRTVFVQEAAEPYIHVYAKGDPHVRDKGDLDFAAASAVLRERGLSGPGGRFKGVAALLDDTLPDALGGPASSAEVYSLAGLEERIEVLNRGYVEDLVEQLRSPLRVMPFVGAGMSARLGFQLWEPFLRQAASDLGVLEEMESLLVKGDYETVAEKLNARNRTRFSHLIDQEFRRDVPVAKLRTGAFEYLPLLTDGPLMTINFDHVLEDAFQAAGRTLEVIEGANHWRTVPAVHRNQVALLKIHGSHDDPTFRVFTRSEFEKGYEGEIASLGWLTFTNRPLLFLGCSLRSEDRMGKVLTEIHARLPGLKHYAILPASYWVDRQREREDELSKWGVSPVWYPPGRHGRVDEILTELVERSAVREIPVGDRPRLPSVRRWDESALRRVDLLEVAAHPETPAIAEAIRSGGVAFFLGAYAHLGRLPLGDDFYEELGTRFGVPELASDRSAVAAFVASRKGPDALWKAIEEALRAPIEPSPLYSLLAALPAFLRARGFLEPTWILTTNYDTVLERTLTEAGEPFHLFYYMEPNGLFAQVRPDGSVRVIHRPEAIRRVDPRGTVVVKLNGGMLESEPPEESVVIASGQFERLATRLPDALPECVRATLTQRSLLFLGHGLQEPDVGKLVELFARGHRRHSWAVQRRPRNPGAYHLWREQVEYREGLGLMTVESDVEEFVAGLKAELLA